MKNLIRAVIFGSRNFKQRKVFLQEVELFLYPFNRIEIVEGGQVSSDFAGRKWGADYFTAEYAKAELARPESSVIMHTTYPANWDLYGNKAGPLRNEIMAEYCSFGYGLAFWDGRIEKCGTYDMMQRCEDHSINLKIIRI